MTNRTAKRGAKDKRLDKDFCHVFITALRSGNTKKAACSLASISEQTFYRWMKEAETASESTTAWEFSESVKKAIAEAQHRNIMLIQKHAQTSWQAAAWYLERSDPDHWGKREKVEMTGKDGGAMEINHISEKNLSNEDMASVLDKFNQSQKDAEKMSRLNLDN